MSNIKITPVLLNEDLDFSPIKYFVSKHSIYPNIVNFNVSKINKQTFFEKLKDKFNDFSAFSSYTYYDAKNEYDYFCLIYDEKDSCIIFYLNIDVFSFYSKYEDEGMVNILSTMIRSCYETEENY